MPRPPEPVAERIARRVMQAGDCLLWLGAKNNGYGVIRLATGRSGGKMALVHRVAYELAHGPIPPGLVIDHLCRNRSCVNVDHLEVVTQYENIKRGNGVVAPRMRDPDHCAQGHEFTEENTIIIRRCRTCHRDVERRKARRRRGVS